jgi:hypothetical protein
VARTGENICPEIHAAKIDTNLYVTRRISTGRYFGEQVKVAEELGGLQQYFHFYNHERVHQALEHRTPAQVYGVAVTYGAPLPSLTYFQRMRHFSFQRVCIPLVAPGHAHHWHRSGGCPRYPS